MNDLSLEHAPPPAPSRHQGGVLSPTFLPLRVLRSRPSPSSISLGASATALRISCSEYEITRAVLVQYAPTSARRSTAASNMSSAREPSFGIGTLGSNLISYSFTFSCTLGAKLLSW